MSKVPTLNVPPEAMPCAQAFTLLVQYLGLGTMWFVSIVERNGPNATAELSFHVDNVKTNARRFPFSRSRDDHEIMREIYVAQYEIISDALQEYAEWVRV